MGGAIMMAIVLLVTIGITLFLIGAMLRSIRREQTAKMKVWKNFGLSLAFCTLFLVSWAAHGIAEWQVFTDEQADINQPVEIGDFVAQFSQGTLENWQSEFLQLMWQVAGLAYLLYVGSPQSKEGDDRKEEKLDEILKLLSPERAEALIAELDEKYPR